ncbi:MAG: hypothetical protein HY319_10410 [Armatimonadetes bacterium]|nr:hypothetical protein [Armatimonadota bacterium]
MTAKERAMELVSQLPDDYTMEDIVYHLYVVDKVQQALDDVENGRVVSHDDARRQLARWLEK